jgi:bacterioferritin
MKSELLLHLDEIRRRARRHIEQGAVTEGYKAPRETILKLLNEALATEIVCVLRYKLHYFSASGIHAQSVASEFLEHANQEQEHADRLAERIHALGGVPDLSPAGLDKRSLTEFREVKTLTEMIREDLIAERIVIEAYGDMIRFVKDGDPTTRRLLENILEVEEEHAEELAKLLMGMNGNGQEKSL